MNEQDMRAEELAVKLKVSLSTVKNIMNGKKPYRPLVTVLAHLMGVNEKDLLVEAKKTRGHKSAGN